MRLRTTLSAPARLHPTHSLTRLGTDYIDLYQLHRPDLDALPEETHEALSDLVRQGKVRAIGTSNHPAELLVRLHWQARRRHLVPVRSEQAPYSLFRRSVERAVLPTATRHGMGVLVYSPLDYGWLTGKYRADAPWPADSRGAALRSIIQFSPAPTAMLDRNMHYLEVSRTWYEFHGLPPDKSILGKSHYAVVPGIPAKWRVEHQRALRGETIMRDSAVVAAEGKTSSASGSIVLPWHTPSGNVGGLILMVTPRGQLESSAAA